MISLDELLEILEKTIKNLRYRYGETFIEGVKIRRNKYEVFININGIKGKIIVNRDNLKTRVYTGLRGQEIAIRKIISREIEKYLRMKKHDR